MKNSAFSDSNINSKDLYGNTLLIESVSEYDIDCVDLLLSHPEIDVNARDNDGNTALIIALEEDFEDISEKLLRVSSIDVNITDQYGSTALIIASSAGNINIVRTLLSFSNIDIFACDKYGLTAIMAASKNCHLPVVKLLHNAIKHKNIDFDITPYSMFYSTVDDKILKYFLYSGVLANSYDLFKNDISLIFPQCFLLDIRKKILLLAGLNSDIDKLEEHKGFFSCFCLENLLNAIRGVAVNPYRLDLLEAKVCGVSFSEDVILTHTGMSIPKFRAVSSLMKSAICHMLEHGVNSYIFAHMLMLRSVKCSRFAGWPFELRYYLLEFILGKGLFVIREDFFAINRLRASTNLLEQKSSEHKVNISNMIRPYEAIDSLSHGVQAYS